MRKIGILQVLLIALLLFSINFSICQNLTYFQQIGGNGNENIFKNLTSNQGIFSLGSFTGGLTVGFEQIQSTGEEDLFIYYTDLLGNLMWIQHLKGAGEAEFQTATVLPSGNLLCTGYFWDELILSDTLRSTINSKSLFLLEIDPSGSYSRFQKIEGTGQKDWESLYLFSDHSILFSLTFNKQIYFDSLTIATPNEKDFMLIKWSEENGFYEPLQIENDATFGHIEVAVSGEKIIVSGDFKGKIGDENIRISTPGQDHDLFYLELRQDSILNLRRFGGVFEDRLLKLVIDQKGNRYLSGTFTGVLNFENLTIQSNGFNSDFFIAKLDVEEAPVWAESFGGRGSEVLTDIIMDGQEMIATGYFNGATSIAGQMSEALTESDLFFMQLDIKNQQAKAFFFGGASIEIDPVVIPIDNQFLVAFLFNGFWPEFFLATDDYDTGFLLVQDLNTSSITAEVEKSKIYPNPAVNNIHLEVESTLIKEGMVFDVNSKLILKSQHSTINIGTLEPGIYLWKIKLTNGTQLNHWFVKSSQ